MIRSSSAARLQISQANPNHFGRRPIQGESVKGIGILGQNHSRRHAGPKPELLIGKSGARRGGMNATRTQLGFQAGGKILVDDQHKITKPNVRPSAFPTSGGRSPSKPECRLGLVAGNRPERHRIESPALKKPRMVWTAIRVPPNHWPPVADFRIKFDAIHGGQRRQVCFRRPSKLLIAGPPAVKEAAVPDHATEAR
jgi:hypothetical protein